MKFFKLPENSRFSNKEILLFILPIFLEQLLIAIMGIADSMMVARSDLGEIAVSGVELAKRIDVLVKQISVALAAGGSVVISQYVGADDKKSSNTALKSTLLSIVALTIIASAIMYILRDNILFGMYKDVEPIVMDQAMSYFVATIFSYPFMALYYSGAASFRAIGNSRIPMLSSLGMMCINLIVKYILIFKLGLGVFGAGFSNLISYAAVGIIIIVLLCNKNNKAYIEQPLKLRWSNKMVLKVFKVGIPNGIENGLFQVGNLILQVLVSTLGTAAIAANGLAHSLSNLLYCVVCAFTLGIITFVSQCMGAGKPEEAEFYAKHIIKWDYACTLIAYIIFMPLVKPIAELFSFSPEATAEGVKSIYVYFTGIIILYPLSFALPNSLRGAGDTKFTMIVSITTMFAFRIGIAYIFVNVFNQGVVSVWYAMILDWAVRSAIFIWRFKQGKWKKIHVI